MVAKRSGLGEREMKEDIELRGSPSPSIGEAFLREMHKCRLQRNPQTWLKYPPI